jgi:peptidoglycan/LPS O-acetylase OafA/YrhL
MKAEGYRSDIDGLRAVAVIPVVLYHFGIWPFTGGFVGVDVFFVISGYLITSILFEELAGRGSISLVGFYNRRARRILPALAFVIVSSLVAGYVLMPPIDLESLGRQSFFSVTGLANVFFLLNTDYFDRNAELLPLLHMWSLSVEEQFYVLWPLILIAAARFGVASRRGIAFLLLPIIVASLALSVYTVERGDASVAFYLLHTRAWELALGALLVFLPAIGSRPVAEFAGGAGLALIGYAIFSLTEDSPFPGVNAVAPCVGAALLIWPKRHDTLAAKALSLAPARFVGLISYSLYLWHWPVLVFFRTYANGTMPAPGEAAVLIALSMLAAAFSWAVVEKPFRRSNRPAIRGVLGGAATIAAVGAVGAVVSASGGVPSRFPPDAARTLAFLTYRPEPTIARCRIEKAGGVARLSDGCVADDGRPNVLIIGDSYASDYTTALPEIFPEAHFAMATSWGCRPVLPLRGRKECVETLSAALKTIEIARFDHVVIGARWWTTKVERLRGMVDRISKHAGNVIVLGQPIEYTIDVPSLLTATVLPRRAIAMKSVRRLSYMRRVNERLKSVLAPTKAKLVSPLDQVCPGGKCRMRTDDGVPIQRDYGHMTLDGARLVVKGLRKDGLRFDKTDAPAGR